MKRMAGGLVLLAAMSSGTSAWAGPFMSSYYNQQSLGCASGLCRAPMAVPDLVGPWGQPVPMAAPYTSMPPDGAMAARAMLANHVPLDILSQTSLVQAGGVPGAFGPSMTVSPPGLPAMPAVPAYPQGAAASPGNNGIRLVAGGPQVGGVPVPPGPPGAVAGVGALTGGGAGSVAGAFSIHRTEIRFVGPAGMRISWCGTAPGGAPGAVVNNYIEAPGRYNFVQAAIYRLRLSDIPNRPGLDLYPTLEIVPANAKTATFLAHSAVPIAFTEEDFEQVSGGNFVVKVIYLPDPRFQDLATIGPDEVVSSRLEPGVDPIAEACRRGCILAIVRIGNIDLEAPNTPAMDAPSPYMNAPQHGAAPRPGVPGSPMMPTGPMMPNGMIQPGRLPIPNNAGPLPQQTSPVVPAVPTTLPVQPLQPAPAGSSGPIGKAPGMASVQQAQLAVPVSKTPTPAEMAVQDKGAASAEKKAAQRRGIFGWFTSPSDR